MTQNETQQKQDKDTLANFAGVSVMFAFLIIIFALTTPGFLGGDSSNQDDADTVEVVQADDETSEEVVLADETVEEVADETTEEVADETAEEVADETSEEVADETSEEVADETVDEVAGDADLIAQGESLFITCSACHGPDAMGIPGLGKDLVNGEYINSVSDEELTTLILTGRPIWDAENTTMIDMPPKGGNPMLNDEDVVAIVAYLRSLGGDADASADTEETASTDETAEDTSEESSEESSEEATDESASSDETATAYDAESVANGESLFITCSACHGPDAMGIPGLGKDLVNGEYALNATDDELATVITSGRPIWDAENTTMIDMPPRGGNPMLTAEDVTDLVAYIRSLQTP